MKTKEACNEIKKRRLKASVHLNGDWIKIDGEGGKIHFFRDGFRFRFADRDV
jgi:hypothetical protein